MIILALEQSTAQNSAVIADDGHILAEEIWSDMHRRNQSLFPALETLIRSAGITLTDIELFAAGIGPGAFSGIRVSLICIRTLAMPAHRPVKCVSSGAALAHPFLQEQPTRRVRIAGDARRGVWWTALFDNSRPETDPAAAYSLVAPDDFSTFLKPDDLIVSPDWDRIGSALTANCPDHVTLIQKPVHPHARDVARLAATASQSITDPAIPITPVYLHPAVVASR